MSKKGNSKEVTAKRIPVEELEKGKKTNKNNFIYKEILEQKLVHKAYKYAYELMKVGHLNDLLSSGKLWTSGITAYQVMKKISWSSKKKGTWTSSLKSLFQFQYL